MKFYTHVFLRWGKLKVYGKAFVLLHLIIHIFLNLLPKLFFKWVLDFIDINIQPCASNSAAKGVGVNVGVAGVSIRAAVANSQVLGICKLSFRPVHSCYSNRKLFSPPSYFCPAQLTRFCRPVQLSRNQLLKLQQFRKSLLFQIYLSYG